MIFWLIVCVAEPAAPAVFFTSCRLHTVGPSLPKTTSGTSDAYDAHASRSSTLRASSPPRDLA